MNTKAQFIKVIENVKRIYGGGGISLILGIILAPVLLPVFLVMAFYILLIRAFQVPLQLIDTVLGLNQPSVVKCILLLFAYPLHIFKFLVIPSLLFVFGFFNFMFNGLCLIATLKKAPWVEIVFLQTFGEYNVQSGQKTDTAADESMQ